MNFTRGLLEVDAFPTDSKGFLVLIVGSSPKDGLHQLKAFRSIKYGKQLLIM
jgi:hypothetical protein